MKKEANKLTSGSQHLSFLEKIIYYVSLAFLYLISLLPFCVLYAISDFIYFIIYRIAGYRVKVVRKNLSESFPEKSEKELRDIERKFYHYLGDYLVETIKMMSISKQDMCKHMYFKNVNVINDCLLKGQSAGIYIGHYGNWEWLTGIPPYLTDKCVCTQIYHVLENKISDRIFLYIRSRMGTVNISMAESLRRVAEYNAAKQPIIVGFISDQAPFWNNIHYWTPFLNHDTPVLSGSERICKKFNYAAVYLDITRPKRGYYQADCVLLAPNSKETEEFEITEKYFRALEKTIQRAPQYWLWTHKRWKRTREEFNRRYDPETGKVDLS